VFDEYDNQFGVVGFKPFPARQTLVGFGYDPNCYISTAKIAPSPYVTQALICAKIGGLNLLTSYVDDSQPPIGTLNPNEPPNNPAYLTYLAIIQNVVTEINGYLSSVYPLPLVQTGTVGIVMVTEIDSLGAITAIEVIHAGNYLAAPTSPNSPAYLRHIDAQANAEYFGSSWQSSQLGSGASLTVTYADTPYSDENGTTIQAQTISGVPVITAGGIGYEVDQLLVLTGGQSFVPAKIRESALILICHSLYQRRLAPEEKNVFDGLAKIWRERLAAIGNDNDEQLDGTYKRFYSAGQSWNTKSVLFGANSL
jgi:uncharacterized protein YuzE